MMTRALLLPLLVVSLFSSAVSFAVAMLAFPPASRAATDQQAGPPVVRAQRFEVVDANGAMRGRLAAFPETGNVSLVLFDPAGSPQAALSAPGYTGGLLVVNRLDKTVYLATSPDGSASLRFLDQVRVSGPAPTEAPEAAEELGPTLGHERVAIGLAPDGTPRLQVLSETGQPIWQAP